MAYDNDLFILDQADIKPTKSLLPKAWNITFVQKAPLVGFEKKK